MGKIRKIKGVSFSDHRVQTLYKEAMFWGNIDGIIRIFEKFEHLIIIKKQRRALCKNF